MPSCPMCRRSPRPACRASRLLGWYGLCGRAGTPEAILDKLHADAMAVLQSPAYRKAAVEQGSDPSPMSRADYAAFLAAQGAKWAKGHSRGGACSRNRGPETDPAVARFSL